MNEPTQTIEGRIVSYTTSFSALGCRYVVIQQTLQQTLPRPLPEGRGVDTFQGQRMSLRVPLSFDPLYVTPGTEFYGKIFAADKGPLVKLSYTPANPNEDRIVIELTINNPQTQ